MRAEKNGFVLTIKGAWYEILNRYGVVGHEDVILPEEVPDDFAEKLLDKFIQGHSVRDLGTMDKNCIKRVAYDAQSKEYIQLQAVHNENDGCWVLQKYDNELVYMGEFLSGCKYYGEMLDWMQINYYIESGMIAEVYRNSLGDCTNGGISAECENLYILGKAGGTFEPKDIRECVYIEWREVMGSRYIDCKPLYFRKRCYMMGGNFLYSSDSRFREITESKYPIPIHDRYEGR